MSIFWLLYLLNRPASPRSLQSHSVCAAASVRFLPSSSFSPFCLVFAARLSIWKPVSCQAEGGEWIARLFEACYLTLLAARPNTLVLSWLCPLPCAISLAIHLSQTRRASPLFISWFASPSSAIYKAHSLSYACRFDATRVSSFFLPNLVILQLVARELCKNW